MTAGVYRTTPQRRVRALAVPVVVAVVVVAVAGCASSGSGGPAGGASPTASTTFHVAAPAPDPSTAAGVAVLALTQIFTWHPASESPGASLSRARRWLGPHLRSVLDQPATGVENPKPSLQWSDWAAKGAIIEASAFASGEQAPDTSVTGPPAGTAGAGGSTPQAQILRRELCKIGIEQTVSYPDGRREALPSTTVIATVVLTSDGWLLDDYR